MILLPTDGREKEQKKIQNKFKQQKNIIHKGRYWSGGILFFFTYEGRRSIEHDSSFVRREKRERKKKDVYHI